MLRADERGCAAGLSTSQLVGVVVVAVAYALHRKLGGAARPPAPATA